MTNELSVEDVIEIFKLRKRVVLEESKEDKVLDVAIKALDQQPCEDCISREDVISLANKGYLVSNSNYKSVCDVINALPSVTPQPTRWIPCSERLPERDVNVLAYHRNISFDYQYVSWIDDNSGRWCGFIGNLSDDVIAWMPLPTPYVPDTNVGEMGESEDK